MQLPEFPQIPVYTIYHSNHIEPATAERPHGSVNEALIDAPIAFESQNHCLRMLPAPRGHTKGEHTIGWFDVQSIMPGEWTDQSWEQLADDDEFLSKLENHITSLQETNPYIRAYFMIGFATEEDAKPFTYSRGLQSIKRGHIHIVDTQNGDEPDRFLDQNDPFDQKLLLIFLNASGEQTIASHPELFNEFGTSCSLTQQLNLPSGNTVELKRTLFGFPSVKEALSSSIKLLEVANEIWLSHAQSLNEQWIAIGNGSLNLKTTPVPGVSIMFPSPIDRAINNIEQHRILVQPMPVNGPMNMFEKNGMILEWKPDMFISRE